MSNEGIEVKPPQIPGAGKGLFARNTFSSGDSVVVVGRPCVAELEAERMLDTCSWCFHREATDPAEKQMAVSMGLPHGSTTVKSCTACRRVAYCSKPCQSKAWKGGHKYECKVISVKDRPDLPPGVRAAIKIIGRLQADPGHQIDQVRDILSLWPAGDPNGLNRIGVEDKKKLEDYTFLGNAAWHYCGKPSIEGLDPQSISTGLLSNIMSNASALASPLDNLKLGIGFDPLIARANHSCDPNALLIFNQPRWEIRALRPIKAGEEIFINYLREPTDPFTLRQATLKDNFFFTCACTKCKQGYSLPADQFLERSEDLSSKYRKLADGFVGKYDEPTLSAHLMPGPDAGTEARKRVAAMEAEAYALLEKTHATTAELKGAIEMCLDSKMWRWTRQPVPQLCQDLLNQHMAAGSVYQAFRIGVKLHCEILPALYPESHHPRRLTNAWIVSTLINVLCGDVHRDVAEEMAQAGLDLRVLYFGFLFFLHDNTSHMYGSDTPFGKVVANTYDQIMAGVTMPVEHMRQKIYEVWPSLETLAYSISASSL